MIVAESICCGTPIAGFQAGGPEAIALPEYSAFAEQGDVDGLEALLRQALASRKDTAAIAAAGQAAYSAETMCAAYLKCYQALSDD